EEYGKTYFTIMDFRNVTDLFADPTFDDDPVMIKQVGQYDDLSGADAEEPDEPLTGEGGEEIEFPEKPKYPLPDGGGPIVEEPRAKVRVDGMLVKVVNERVQYLDADGKIITEDLRDYTRKNVTKQFKSLDDFLTRWNSADQKKAIIEELEAHGIFFEALKDEVGKDYDLFDLICHVAYEAKPLTRQERANNVKKKNYFTKYGDKAQAVIKSLLDKYADDGLITIESTEVLKLDPLNKLGTPVELIKAFGNRAQYLEAIKELEKELYQTA
ncbi:MAG: restriction endonuclease, partial [Pontibacter sp.]|nr:restriction endonuclease [Pontibacter sp.]